MKNQPRTNRLRGREVEWGLVLDLLDGTRRGKGGVLLVEGEPGSGKTTLLAAAAEVAGDHGFVLGTSDADELARFTPLAPLHAAMPGAVPGPARRPVVTRARWQTGNLRVRLEELASAGPMLLALDDLNWADPATLHALRSLPGRLAHYPLAWILARSSHGGSRAAGLVFETLMHAGAVRAVLQPLPEETQVAVMADVLGGVPDANLVERAGCAAGNPFLLTEFLSGLLDENAVNVTEGRVSLVSRRIPQRYRMVMCGNLGRLTARTRRLLETGALLGRSFRLEDAAAMLGEPPGSLLAEVEEALAAQIVVSAEDTIAFRHNLVWQVVADSLSSPVAQALHRQAGEMLLARGDATVTAADHLLAAARPGDPVVLAGLDRVAVEMLRFSPATAAELAVRALDLTRADAPERPARAVAAVRALTAAGLWDEAEGLARSGLAVPVQAGRDAELRCALASLHAMNGRAAEALIEAESILADPELAPEVRNDAKIVLLQALTGLRDNEKAGRVATAILAERHAERPEVVVAALLVLALAAWDSGRGAEAIGLSADAVRAETGQPPQAQRLYPDLFLAARLINVHRFSEAQAVMNSLDRLDAPPAVSWTASSTHTLRARMALAAGRLDDTAAEAGFALGRASTAGTRLHNIIARTILATVSLRRGDLLAAAGYLGKSLSPVSHFVAGYEMAWSQVISAQVEEAQNGPYAVLDMLGGIYADLQAHRYPLLSDPVTAAWLVRVALAAGDRERAETVAWVMAEISRSNPDVPLYRACADHARGVLDSDERRLEQAADLHDDPWAAASAAEDLGGVLAAAGRRDEAVRRLDAALAGYAAAGADRDAARLRRKLREQGIRRRHWAAAKRPETGWDSLTDTEGNVGDLVAHGLTNQQVADQMFLSVHTVAFHLRQVFRKLGVRSRVELARAAAQRSVDGGQGGADAG